MSLKVTITTTVSGDDWQRQAKRTITVYEMSAEEIIDAVEAHAISMDHPSLDLEDGDGPDTESIPVDEGELVDA